MSPAVLDSSIHKFQLQLLEVKKELHNHGYRSTKNTYEIHDKNMKFQKMRSWTSDSSCLQPACVTKIIISQTCPMLESTLVRKIIPKQPA